MRFGQFVLSVIRPHVPVHIQKAKRVSKSRHPTLSEPTLILLALATLSEHGDSMPERLHLGRTVEAQ
jgi:hypothetical protein